jgi:hypothetical protein
MKVYGTEYFTPNQSCPFLLRLSSHSGGSSLLVLVNSKNDLYSSRGSNTILYNTNTGMVGFDAIAFFLKGLPSLGR